MQQRRMSGVMRMYEKLKTLKDKLQKMKTNRANRQIGQTFHFSPLARTGVQWHICQVRQKGTKIISQI